ncbi:unnamed protein product [Phytophthora fragariaefolia]|uniref:Unnamed protein product n=1 Tax=Phytophthora fragariaefolia TaxID=1490495 RepID=A0A9W7CSQ3_9STRA|nr:unnamed protein product [Phytophthora fragariaefolia]
MVGMQVESLGVIGNKNADCAACCTKLDTANFLHKSQNHAKSRIARLFQLKKVSPGPLPASLAAARPSEQGGKPRRDSNLVIQQPLGLTFRQAFGPLGIPLLIVVLVCIAWTSWLIFLSVAPNEAANLLMNTGDYDNGNFWLIVERAPFVKWASVLGLLLVTSGYVFIFVKLVCFRHTTAEVYNDKGILWIDRGWNAMSTWWMLHCTPSSKSRLMSIHRLFDLAAVVMYPIYSSASLLLLQLQF